MSQNGMSLVGTGFHMHPGQDFHMHNMHAVKLMTILNFFSFLSWAQCHQARVPIVPRIHRQRLGSMLRCLKVVH